MKATVLSIQPLVLAWNQNDDVAWTYPPLSGLLIRACKSGELIHKRMTKKTYQPEACLSVPARDIQNYGITSPSHDPPHFNVTDAMVHAHNRNFPDLRQHACNYGAGHQRPTHAWTLHANQTLPCPTTFSVPLTVLHAMHVMNLKGRNCPD